jgi:hypothetical protein
MIGDRVRTWRSDGCRDAVDADALGELPPRTGPTTLRADAMAARVLSTA